MPDGKRRRQTYAAVLSEQSGPRMRVLDEHMYRVERAGTKATFRLQLFTAPGLRPVAVATQELYEGKSLVNGCETFCEHVWRTHFPDEQQPPVWVQRLAPSGQWNLVTFDVGPDYSLSRPRWPTVTEQQLDRLVGGQVDADRGSGFVPWPTGPVYRTRYVQARLARMPRSRPFRAECMTSGRSWWRWLLRRLRPRAGWDCCWYHRGDWRQVNITAARLLHAAEAAEVDSEEIAEFVRGAARAEGVTGWDLEALDSLFSDPIFISDPEDGTPAMFANGQHRVQGMRDAGVTMTVIGRDELVTTAD